MILFTILTIILLAGVVQATTYTCDSQESCELALGNSDITKLEILYQLNDSGNGWSACFAGMHEFSDLLFDLQKPFWIKTNLEESHSEEWTFDDEQTYNITEGWNLISYPWTEEKLIEDVLDASVSNNIRRIYEFDNDTWKLWMKDVPVNPLQTMKPGKAYWIYSTNNFTMNFNSGIASD